MQLVVMVEVMQEQAHPYLINLIIVVVEVLVNQQVLVEVLH